MSKPDDDVFQPDYYGLNDLLANNDCIQCGRPTEFDFKYGGYYELCEECQTNPDDDEVPPNVLAAQKAWDSMTLEEKRHLFGSLQNQHGKNQEPN